MVLFRKAHDPAIQTPISREVAQTHHLVAWAEITELAFWLAMINLRLNNYWNSRSVFHYWNSWLLFHYWNNNQTFIANQLIRALPPAGLSGRGSSLQSLTQQPPHRTEVAAVKKLYTRIHYLLQTAPPAPLRLHSCSKQCILYRCNFFTAATLHHHNWYSAHTA